MNILISAAATPQAYQLDRIINGAPGTVFLADSVDLPPFPIRGRKFIKIPEGGSPSFAHELLTICLDNAIEKVFVLRKAEIWALAEARVLFDEFGIQVIVPSVSVLKQFGMKKRSGTILLKEDQDKNSDLPDRGVFLVNMETPEPEISILTAD